MTMETHIVYLALGSNLGDRLENLRQAIAALSPQMEVKAKSHVYETPPWGYEDQPKFYNQAIKADTYLQPEPLLKHLKRLEVALGRQPNFRNGPRSIDIDLLFYDQVVLNTSILSLPHPRLHERGFVLLPRRWVVERSFAWMARFRRLVRDYERLSDTLAGMHFIAFTYLMLRRLLPELIQVHNTL